MKKNRTINIFRFSLYIFIIWGLWYVFFNSSVILRPYYNLLWPFLVISGVVFNIGKICNYYKYNRKYQLICICFVAVNIISLVVSHNLHLSLEYLIKLFLAYMFVLVIAVNDVDDIFFEVTQFYLLIHLLISFIQFLFPALYMNYFLPLIAYNDSPIMAFSLKYHYSVGFTTDPSQNGLMMSMGFCLFYSKVLTQKKNKCINIILTISYACMTFFTGKRSYTLIVIFLSVYLYIFLCSKDRMSIFVHKMLLLLLILSILVFVIIESNIFKNLIDKTLELIDSGDISNGRFARVKKAFSLLKDNFIFGVGINSISVLMGGDVHNSYIQWITEYGVLFSGFAFLFILYLPYKSYVLFKGIEIKVIRGNDFTYIVFSYSFIILVLISGLFALPFQWPNTMMFYFVSSFLFYKLTCKYNKGF